MGSSRQSSGSSSRRPASSGSANSKLVAGDAVDEEAMYAELSLSTLSQSLGRNSYAQDTGGDSSCEVDDFDAEHMSDYPASMTSSVREHVYEGGIRYHAFRDGKYPLPNDEVEQTRDDMKHTMTLMLMRDKLFYAPVQDVLEKGGEVYDLGTGTGIWAIELADKYPKSIVRGVDLSPIQPNYVPDNVFFMVDDFEDEWVYPENMFDFIHVRHTLFAVQERTELLQRLYRHLKPGGYVEFQEIHFTPQCDDDSLKPDTPYAFRDFLAYMEAGLRALRSDMHGVASLPDELRAAGFTGIEHTTHKCPLGSWPRDKRLRYCGLFMRTTIMDGLRGVVRRPLGNGLGWTPLQIEVFLIDVRKAIMDGSIHAYFPFHVVYAQKPTA